MTSFISPTSTSVSLGLGTNYPLWHCIWSGESLRKHRFPTFFSFARKPSGTIASHFKNGSWENPLHQPLSDRASAELASLLSEICHLSPSSSGDQLAWRCSCTNKHSVSSTYSFLSNCGICDAFYNLLWKLDIPLKLNIFVWLTICNTIPTSENLQKRGWPNIGNYSFCASKLEISPITNSAPALLPPTCLCSSSGTPQLALVIPSLNSVSLAEL